MALAACARTRYDLILMDGRMPELDGASATRMIRAGGPAEAPVRDRDLMIIALTANASEEDRARYLASGMDDFLSKPIDEAALHAQLSRAIERQLGRGIALAPMPPRRRRARARRRRTRCDVRRADRADAAGGGGGAERRAPHHRPEGAHADRFRRRPAGPARRSRRGDRTRRTSETAARLLHGIKGSAAYLDATELHLLCGELEVAADQREWGVVGAAMPRLRRLLDTFEGGAT